VNLPRNQILQGDARERLSQLPPESIDCVVTSPPYPFARDYQVEGQLGQERDVEGWVANLRAVMREVGRVLKPTGSAWVNVGDVYSKHPCYGAPAKSALLAPERLVIALLEDGWRIRGKVAWVKSNGQPSSVRDRLANRYEHLFFVVRSGKYFFDLDSIREPHRTKRARSTRQPSVTPAAWAGPLAGTQAGLYRARYGRLAGDPLGRNPGDVWEFATAGFRGPHFAVFPKALARRPILATCPELACSCCGRPWRRNRIVAGAVPPVHVDPGRQPVMEMGRGPLRSTCDCQAEGRPGVVCDPFLGSGTTAVVARELGRDFVGIELSRIFCRLAESRLAQEVTP
jgi:DNA modification methylase